MRRTFLELPIRQLPSEQGGMPYILSRAYERAALGVMCLVLACSTHDPIGRLEIRRLVSGLPEAVLNPVPGQCGRDL